MNSETNEPRGTKAWEPMKVNDVGDLVKKVGTGGGKPISAATGDPGEPRKTQPSG